MKAAVLHKPGERITIEDIAVRKPRASEVLVRTSFAGICHSDMGYVDGYLPSPMPLVLGHEAAGIIEQVGEHVSYVKPGDRVITCTSAFCGECDDCVTGRPALCSDTRVKPPPAENDRLSWKGQRAHQLAFLGSFAEQMLVHEHAVVKVREEMPLDRAAIIGCAVVTGVGSVFNSARMEPGSVVAVIGCGGVGMSCVNGVALAGASRIIAVDVSDEKLAIARRMGATDVVNPKNGDTVQQILDLTNGGVQYSFECIGRKVTAEQAFMMLRPGGTATIIGAIPADEKIELTGMFLLRDRRIQGAIMGSNRFRVDMPRLVDFYLQGRLHLDELISGHIGLENINEGMDELRTASVLRNIIAFPN
jgi:S-(hydroxymethyl)glutathione dehydrogenase/alcohol dehydrogenase